MNKAEYRSLSWEERTTYFNARMETGEKLSHICKEVGIANNAAVAARANGWHREGPLKLFVYHEPQHPGQMNIGDRLSQAAEEEVSAGHEDEQEETEGKEGSIMPVNDNKPTQGQPVPLEQTEQPKRMGRPPRTGEKPKKMTVEISQEVYKALQFYKIDNGIFVNGFIEELIKANVPEKYFDI